MCVQVAYTTGYEAVMPVYSQPMMSAGQMSEDVVTNPQSMNGHMGTCGEEYVAVVTDTEYTGAEDYYTTQTFVPVPDQAHSESSSDVCLNEEAPVDRAVIYSYLHSTTQGSCTMNSRPALKSH